MNKNKFYWLSFSLLLVMSLTGCAMWPSLQEDSTVDPEKASIPACQSLKIYEKYDNGEIKKDSNNQPIKKNVGEYDIAKSCAYLTMGEFSKMLEDTGNFDRAAAYAALGIGTAVGSVLGFNGTEDTLKGLGIGSGSLLGLTSIVKTDMQRAILGKALKDVSCLIRAADAINYETPDKNQIQANIISQEKDMIGLADPTDSKALLYDYVTQDFILSGKSYLKAMEAKKNNIPGELASAVNEIRMDVRQKLSSMSSPQTVLSEQRDRIDDMIGGLLEKAKHKKESEEKLLTISLFALDDANRTKFNKLLAETPVDPNDEFKERLDLIFSGCASEPAKSAHEN